MTTKVKQNKLLDDLIPKLRQEFVLVIFLMFAFAVSQLSSTVIIKSALYSIILFGLVVWLTKVFIEEDASTYYSNVIILMVSLSLVLAGWYGFDRYYDKITSQGAYSLFQYLYLFFPVFVGVEGALMLIALLGQKAFSFNLANKVETDRPLVGDFVVVALATVVLIFLGNFVMNFPWYLNICLVLTVNLIIINQFGGQTIKAQ